MKYLKIELLQSSTTNQIIYPTDYQSKIGNKNLLGGGLYYDEGDKHYLLLVVSDDCDYSTISEKSRISVLTVAEAKDISEKQQIRTEKITDEAKIRRLELKVKMSVELTADDLKAIDVEDDTPGFGKEKIYADEFQELEDAVK